MRQQFVGGGAPISRRTFVRGAAVGLAAIGHAGATRVAVAAASEKPAQRARIAGYAACSWTLRDGSPNVFAVAHEIGLDGVQLDLGSPPDFAVGDAAARAPYKAAAEAAGVKVASVALGCLNSHPLKSDPRAPGWVLAGIEAAADFGVGVLLLAFFGDGELRDQAEMDRVGDILKEIAPAAAKKGVRLGLENTLSARQSLGIIERSASDAVAVYYDVGNARHWGHDALAELPLLGPRVCEIHFKDGVNSYGDALLGEGKVDYPGVARTLHRMGYAGWITLEPHTPELVPDMKRNLAFARRIMSAA